MSENKSEPVELLLTPAEAAKALRISVRKLRYLANGDKRRGLPAELPKVEIGGSIRFDVADVRRLIEVKKCRTSVASRAAG